ncbi:glycosyltransferase family 25 protein [Cenococcum geophilum 1.58]|uniref:glycosyltransferase family 25 protein n=1 Tax=Cenococcum geophilum 1.58 TaxID=794803 RepID=UPI00358F6F50|nr:glycosyltransferase family 25 protein [Cenococcum geophilum 1.58]
MFPLFLHHLIMDRSSRCLLLLLALCIAPIIYFFSNGGWNSSSPRKSRGLPPANATLGFGAVVAVSHATSPRRSALVFAANMTSIDLTIPDQPVWTDADLEAFHSPKGSRIKKGSALAWMGHLSALKWFLSTDLETAIILEDDVDWDIHLRTSQVPLAAAAMQQLLTTHPPTKTPARRGARSTYWGPLDWELLFLGHCGDIFPESQLQESAFLAYADDSLMPAARLHTKTAAFLRRLGMPEHVRLAHRSHWPLCTFAYGQRGDGGCQAFDVRVLEACRDHDWRCYTVNPELFHHIEAPSEITNTLKGTPNIACGVRHPGFYTEDAGTLAWLKAVVGEQGVCLVDQMEEDMSRWP